MDYILSRITFYIPTLTDFLYSVKMHLLQSHGVDACFVFLSMDIKTAVEKYLNKCRSDKNGSHTLQAKKRRLGYFCEYFNGENIETITIDDIYDYLEDEEFSSDEVEYRSRLYIRKIFEYFNDLKVTNLPFNLIELEKPTNKPHDYITEEEWSKVESVLHDNLDKRIYIRLHAILHIMYDTGLRRSEIKKIRLQDVDFKDQSFVVETVKTKCYRRCYFNFDFDQYIETFEPKDQLFNLGGNRINDLLKEVVRQAGINKKITCHCFRVAFITRLSRNGASIQDISRLVGHKSIESTMRYLRTDDNYLRSIYDNYNKTPKTYEIKMGTSKKSKVKLELRITRK